MSFLGGLAGAALSIGGALFGRRENRRTQSTNQANVERQFRNAERDRQLQREFAQHGVRWRVADAKAAGLHPLFALGGTGATFSPAPVNVGVHGGSGGSIARGFASAGQDLSRAIDSTRTKRERRDARLEILALDRAQLQNELLKAQIAKLNATQVGPAMPSSLPSAVPEHTGGSGEAFITRPVEVPAVQSGRPSQEAGAFPETRWMRTERGGFQPVPSREVIEDADISNPAALSWYFRNQFLPSLGFRGSGSPPPERFLPKGAKGWRWNTMEQAWEPIFRFRSMDKFFARPRKGQRVPRRRPAQPGVFTGS